MEKSWCKTLSVCIPRQQNMRPPLGEASCRFKPILHDGVICCKIFLPTCQSHFGEVIYLLTPSFLTLGFPQVFVFQRVRSHSDQTSLALVCTIPGVARSWTDFSAVWWAGQDWHLSLKLPHISHKNIWNCPLQSCKSSACFKLNFSGKSFRQARRDSATYHVCATFSSFE